MNEPTAIIDSNVLVALIDARDNWHPKAKELLKILEVHHVNFVYVDCVLNETISVLGRRSEEQKRSEQFGDLLSTLLRQVPVENITWISSEVQRLYLHIIEQVKQSTGTLNFHDALIALFAQEAEIPVIISFDRDFDQVSWLTRIAQHNDVPKIFGKGDINMKEEE